MDQSKYTTFDEALQAIPDPRKARGKRYPWHFLLRLIALALASGQRTVHAIADWILLHADELCPQLQWEGESFPSESTLRRTLRLIVLVQLEEILTSLQTDSAPTLPEPAPTAKPHPSEGKRWMIKPCGVCAHGVPLHLVSLVRHTMVVAEIQMMC